MVEANKPSGLQPSSDCFQIVMLLNRRVGGGLARCSAGRGVRAPPPPRDWLQLRQEASDRIRTTASKPTTTDSPRPPRKSKKRKEINPTRKRHDRLSRASSQCRNCVITDGIGDLSNLCPAITERTNPQAVFLHISRKEKRSQTNRSDFEQAASRDAPIRTSSRTRRYGDDPFLSGYVK